MAIYRLLLRLLPAPFRAQYMDAMLSAFDEERQDPRYRGPGGTVRFWIHILHDLFTSCARQRSHQVRASIRSASGAGTPTLPPHTRSSELDTQLQDVRYALRSFARRPVFTAIAVLSLTLGIGGSTLIYGLVDGLILTPFAYPDPDRLVTVGASFPRVSSDVTYVEALSPAEYADIRQARAFSSIAAFDLGNRNVSGGDVPERVFTAFLLDDPFPVLGMSAALGRGFTREELGPSSNTLVAIISHRLWQSRFGADTGVLSRGIRIGGRRAAIVGVMPPGLLLAGTDLWVPWGGDPSKVPRNARQFTVLARLAPGVTLQDANTELSLTAARIDAAERARFKEYEGWRLPVTPWAAAVMQDSRPAAFVLLGAVAFVLLIACANLANLFLARSTTRQRELAVRLALGAGRWRIARHLLTESMLIAVAGGAAGMLLAQAGLRAARSLVPAQFATMGVEPAFSGRVLACGILLAAAAGILVGILPALQAARIDPQDSLKSDSRAGGGGQRVRKTLVVAEIALSVALLLGAGLLMRSFINLQQVDPGFDPRGVLTMRLTLPQEKYRSGEAITTFFEELIRRVEAVPGVRSVAMASQFPPQEPFSTQIEVEGVAAGGTQLPSANTTIASSGYFETLGVRLIAGQRFTGKEAADGVRQVIVNESFVARFTAGRQPVGTRVRMVGRGGQGPWAEIVAVAADTRNIGIGAPPRPEVFIPMEQGRDAWNQLFLLVRSEQPGTDLLPAVRQAVASLDPEQPVYAIQTLEEALALSTFQARASTLLLAIFAGVALTLAAVGVYGVTAYSVSSRTQEIGVRLAVGAQRAQVMWLVMRQVLRLSIVGLAIGVGLVLAGGRALEGLLFGVNRSDPVAIGAAAGVLTIVAILAAWVPALRASRVDPIEALRYE